MFVRVACVALLALVTAAESCENCEADEIHFLQAKSEDARDLVFGDRSVDYQYVSSIYMSRLLDS